MLTRREIRNQEDVFYLPKHVFKAQCAYLEQQRRAGEVYEMENYPDYDVYLSDEAPYVGMLVEKKGLFPYKFYFVTINGIDRFFQGYYQGEAAFFRKETYGEVMNHEASVQFA